MIGGNDPRGHLRVLGWVLSSSWVSGGIWCDAPMLCAPKAAARPNRQTFDPVESGEAGHLRSRSTFCPVVVGEGRPPHGWEPPPEPCPSRTPFLLDREDQVMRKILNVEGFD